MRFKIRTLRRTLLFRRNRWTSVAQGLIIAINSLPTQEYTGPMSVIRSPIRRAARVIWVLALLAATDLIRAQEVEPPEPPDSEPPIPAGDCSREVITEWQTELFRVNWNGLTAVRIRRTSEGIAELLIPNAVPDIVRLRRTDRKECRGICVEVFGGTMPEEGIRLPRPIGEGAEQTERIIAGAAIVTVVSGCAEFGTAQIVATQVIPPREPIDDPRLRPGPPFILDKDLPRDKVPGSEDSWWVTDGPAMVFPAVPADQPPDVPEVLRGRADVYRLFLHCRGLDPTAFAAIPWELRMRVSWTGRAIDSVDLFFPDAVIVCQDDPAYPPLEEDLRNRKR